MKDPYKAIVDLAYKAMKHRVPGKPDIFLYISPHVNLMEINIYRYGWRCEGLPDERFHIYLEEEIGDDPEKCLTSMQKAYREIIAKGART